MKDDQLIKYVTDRKDADYLYGGENYVIDLEDMNQLLNGRIINFDVNMEYGCTLELSEDLKTTLHLILENKGEWIREDIHSSWKCSRCNTYAIEDFEHCEIRSPFCPNCGADMREESGFPFPRGCPKRMLKY